MSHAALIVGAVPALVALIVTATGRGVHRPGRVASASALALGGVAIVAGRRRGRRDRSAATRSCSLSVTLSGRLRGRPAALLRGRDPIAVTAVQMLAGVAAGMPNAAFEGLPPAPPGAAPVLALAALATLGTLRRSRCSPTGSRASPAELRARS